MDTRNAVESAAAVLGLKIAAEYRAGVESYYEMAARMADLVQGLPLTAADEPGNVFRPVEPELGA